MPDVFQSIDDIDADKQSMIAERLESLRSKRYLPCRKD